jgi:RNA polymerase sigma-70 factor (ECF subfamily)
MPLQSLSYQSYADEELLLPVANGNSDAFDELYVRYAQKLFGYFFRMLWKNKELAEDCTQELFLKIIKHAKDFDRDKKLSTWLFSIANNMCKNEYRKAENTLKYQAVKEEKINMPSDKNMDLRKFKEAVHVCIEELDEAKKSLFTLRFKEQLTVPEISAILHIPDGTVKSRLFNLLKELKDKLTPFKNIYKTQ